MCERPQAQDCYFWGERQEQRGEAEGQVYPETPLRGDIGVKDLHPRHRCLGKLKVW